MYSFPGDDMGSLRDMEEKAASILGFKRQTMGKTQARQEFFPLVDALTESCLAVEITDHNKPVAVILSYQKYVALAAKVCMLSNELKKPSNPDLVGSIQVNGKNLEAASQRIAKKFKSSMKETAGKL